MELLDRINEYIEKQSIPQVKTVFNHDEPGLSAGRNLGFKQSKGDIIAFIDDDALPSHDWAEEMVKTYDNDSVIGVTGPSIPLWADETVTWVPEEFYWIIGGSGYSEWTEKREVRNVSGTNMSFAREAFNSGGLFSTHLGAKGGGKTGKHELVGDETEFSIRAKRKTGRKILYNPTVKVQHKVYRYRVNPMFVARRGYWEGYTKAMFKNSYLNHDSDGQLLRIEYQLLKRILTRLFPEIIAGFFTRPAIAWRKLSMTINATVSVAAGYFVYSLQRFLGRSMPVINEEEVIET
jgi:GT2 family glycosyltransferase